MMLSREALRGVVINHARVHADSPCLSSHWLTQVCLLRAAWFPELLFLLQVCEVRPADKGMGWSGADAAQFHKHTQGRWWPANTTAPCPLTQGCFCPPSPPCLQHTCLLRMLPGPLIPALAPAAG